MYDGGFGMGWFMMLLAAGLVVLLVIAVVALVVWLIVRSRKPGGIVAGPGRGLDILQERYARGELTREQYEEMRKYLGG